VKVGDEVREVKSSLDRAGHVIVTATTANDAVHLAENLIDTVNIETK